MTATTRPGRLAFLFVIVTIIRLEAQNETPPPLRSAQVVLPNQEQNVIKTSWPGIGCWFWGEEEFKPEGYKLFRVGDWTSDFEGQPFDGSAHLPTQMTLYDSDQLIQGLRSSGVEPQTPPAVKGLCRLLDGTHILTSAERSVMGDPIQATLKTPGGEARFNAVGMAAVRFNGEGKLEALAAGGLKSFTGGDLDIELADRADVALWRDKDGSWRGLLQGLDGAVPAPLARITMAWTRLSLPTDLGAEHKPSPNGPGRASETALPGAAVPTNSSAKYDVVVYGGTAGGVITAVAAAREGLKVVLLEPRQHLGGMMTGGLSCTDYGKKEVIGGYALEFFWRLGNYYGMRAFGQDAAWYFEPRVAERVFQDMIREAGVTVLYGRRLREKTGVKKEGRRLLEIFMENGASFAGRIFADCTYEGDLMAQSGVSYTWGREGIETYDESLAGVRDKTPYHQFTVNISPYDAGGKLLPEISSDPAGAVGSADRKVQTYNYRMILSLDKTNQAPFPKPAAYSPARYELLARMLKAMTEKQGRAPRFGELANPIMIPNQKADANNNGAFSTDFIGKNYAYPEGDYKTREKIWQEHYEYIAGFFYFLAHDPQVPPALQEEVNRWGLAKDEFTDNQNWPNQLYIREARRMIGEYVVVQKDLQTDLAKPDPIGMGSYNSDSHNIQRIVTQDGFVINEGDMQVAVKPYQIPYRAILPKRTEIQNLLVPVCFSASHVAYSSLRMEPQYMILGQAAGVAACLALDRNVPVQEVDPATLTKRLLQQGAVLEYRAPPTAPTAKEFWRLGRFPASASTGGSGGM